MSTGSSSKRGSIGQHCCPRYGRTFVTTPSSSKSSGARQASCPAPGRPAAKCRATPPTSSPILARADITPRRRARRGDQPHRSCNCQGMITRFTEGVWPVAGSTVASMSAATMYMTTMRLCPVAETRHFGENSVDRADAGAHVQCCPSPGTLTPSRTSPVVSTTAPPRVSTLSRNNPSCWASAPRIASPCRSHPIALGKLEAAPAPRYAERA